MRQASSMAGPRGWGRSAGSSTSIVQAASGSSRRQASSGTSARRAPGAARGGGRRGRREAGRRPPAPRRGRPRRERVGRFRPGRRGRRRAGSDRRAARARRRGERLDAAPGGAPGGARAGRRRRRWRPRRCGAQARSEGRRADRRRISRSRATRTTVRRSCGRVGRRPVGADRNDDRRRSPRPRGRGSGATGAVRRRSAPRSLSPPNRVDRAAGQDDPGGGTVAAVAQPAVGRSRAGVPSSRPVVATRGARGPRTCPAACAQDAAAVEVLEQGHDVLAARAGRVAQGRRRQRAGSARSDGERLELAVRRAGPGEVGLDPNDPPGRLEGPDALGRAAGAGARPRREPAGRRPTGRLRAGPSRASTSGGSAPRRSCRVAQRRHRTAPSRPASTSASMSPSTTTRRPFVRRRDPAAERPDQGTPELGQRHARGERLARRGGRRRAGAPRRRGVVASSSARIQPPTRRLPAGGRVAVRRPASVGGHEPVEPDPRGEDRRCSSPTSQAVARAASDFRGRAPARDADRRGDVDHDPAGGRRPRATGRAARTDRRPRPRSVGRGGAWRPAGRRAGRRRRTGRDPGSHRPRRSRGGGGGSPRAAAASAGAATRARRAAPGVAGCGQPVGRPDGRVVGEDGAARDRRRPRSRPG